MTTINTNDGGPAFPNNWEVTCKGMSLRDWFAGQALMGIAHEQRMKGFATNPDDVDIQWAAEMSYLMADAMLAARAKEADHAE